MKGKTFLETNKQTRNLENFNGVQLTPALRKWISTMNLKYKAIFLLLLSEAGD